MGVNHTMISRRMFWSSYGSDQALCLKVCVWQIFLGCEERDGGEGGGTTEGWCSFVFIMTYIDSVAQSIPLVSSVLYTYWLSTSKCPTSSRSINQLHTLCIILEVTANVIFKT